MKTLIYIFFSMIVISCSCYDQNSTENLNKQFDEGDNNITEKYWKLIELTGQQIKFDENQKKEIHIILKNEDNHFIGNGGCNNISGEYEMIEGNRIKFSKVISTKMYCNNLETEDRFLGVLDKVDNYTIQNDTLSLNKSKMATLAKFIAVYLK
ncbi:MAG: META domain-containing protein [Ignavibacteriales bacterium]|nr:META domain-containing protein [Ignavibacteriales bacterium]